MSVETRIILGIETSCDDTSVAIVHGKKILANYVSSQSVHESFGGVVPELASRCHLESIIPVLELALTKSKVNLNDIDGIAFTQGPGLLGSLMVGVSFAKGLALALNKPLIPVHHMKAHILAHFIEDSIKSRTPTFPFLCLTVSGGHTQIVRVDSYSEMSILGKTIDDAAGEAFDKAAKMLNLSYPGGPLIDELAKKGNPNKFVFSKPKVPDLNFSFSGLKTSILYNLKKWSEENQDFVVQNLSDLCASVQKTIVDVLMEKLLSASQMNNIKSIAIAGGVSANSELRSRLQNLSEKGFEIFIPKFEYCTDNAAMIAMAGNLIFDQKTFANQDVSAQAKMEF